MILYEISQKKVNQLESCKSFQHKKLLLTLAFDTDETIESLDMKIKRFQTMVAKEIKYIREIVRESTNNLMELKSLPSDGGIIFCGLIRSSGGGKCFFMNIVTPLIEGYENYFNGVFETRFFLHPLKEYLKLSSKEKFDDEKKHYASILSLIKKEISKEESKIIIGSSHSKRAIKEGKVKKVIISNKLKNMYFCNCCEALIPIGLTLCNICQTDARDLKKPVKSCYNEIQDLCEESATELICFSNIKTYELDNNYAKIVCFLRF